MKLPKQELNSPGSVCRKSQLKYVANDEDPNQDPNLRTADHLTEGKKDKAGCEVEVHGSECESAWNIHHFQDLLHLTVVQHGVCQNQGKEKNQETGNAGWERDGSKADESIER